MQKSEGKMPITSLSSGVLIQQHSELILNLGIISLDVKKRRIPLAQLQSRYHSASRSGEFSIPPAPRSIRTWEAVSVGRPDLDTDGRRSETTSHIESIFRGASHATLRLPQI